eukprot:XP_019925164.1 PREDICTED: uncharacterized protein LOC109619476 [Crassostrea gigas]
MSKAAQPAKNPDTNPAQAFAQNLLQIQKMLLPSKARNTCYRISIHAILKKNFKSAEQACQLTKAIRTGNLVAADKIRDAKSALECSNTVTNTPRWGDEADNVMEKILCAKIDHLKEMNDLLASSRPHTIFAHSVYDLYWGTGLDSEKPAHTAPDAWPGQNKFGKLLQRLADKRRTKPRSVSMSRAVKTRQQGIDKYTC